MIDLETLTPMLMGLAILIAMITLIVGLIKKTVWLCVVGGVIVVLVGFVQPEQLEGIKTAIESALGGFLSTFGVEEHTSMLESNASVIFPKVSNLLSKVPFFRC